MDANERARRLRRARTGYALAAIGLAIALVGSAFGHRDLPLGPLLWIVLGTLVYLPGSVLVISVYATRRGSRAILWLRLIRLGFVAAFLIGLFRLAG